MVVNKVGDSVRLDKKKIFSVRIKKVILGYVKRSKVRLEMIVKVIK